MTIVTAFDSRMRVVGEICATFLHRVGPAMDADVRVVELPEAKTPPASWRKVGVIRQVLASTKTPAVWIDADCLVLRPVPILSELEHNPACDIFPSVDWNGICMAVFVVRNTPWSEQFLSTLEFCGDTQQHVWFGEHLGTKWEQNTTKRLAQSFPSVARKVCCLPASWVTDTPQHDHSHSFPIHHFGCLTIEQRYKEMSKYD